MAGFDGLDSTPSLGITLHLHQETHHLSREALGRTPVRLLKLRKPWLPRLEAFKHRLTPITYETPLESRSSLPARLSRTSAGAMRSKRDARGCGKARRASKSSKIHVATSFLSGHHAPLELKRSGPRRAAPGAHEAPLSTQKRLRRRAIRSLQGVDSLLTEEEVGEEVGHVLIELILRWQQHRLVVDEQ